MTPFVLLDVRPHGVRATAASAAPSAAVQVYPDSPHGLALARMRRACGLSLLEARDVLGLESGSALHALENGRKVMAFSSDWALAESMLLKVAKTLEGRIERTEIFRGGVEAVNQALGRRRIVVEPEIVAAVAGVSRLMSGERQVGTLEVTAAGVAVATVRRRADGW